LLRQARHLL